jgi:hypothetical protein
VGRLVSLLFGVMPSGASLIGFIPSSRAGAMANVANEADRLLEAGRKKILRTCLLFGGPLLAIMVLAGFQYAGAVRLEEYFAADPDKVDQGVVWRALAVLALLQFLCWGIGVLQG